LAQTMLLLAAAQMAELAATLPASLEQAALTIAAARRIYCVGMRSSHAIAWQFHYILTMIDSPSILLDGPGGTGIDRIGQIGAGDVLLAVSVAPYTRATIDLAELANAR